MVVFIETSTARARTAARKHALAQHCRVPDRRPLAVSPGSMVFLGRLAKDRLVEFRVGEQTLQPSVFPLQDLQEFCLLGTDAAVHFGPSLPDLIDDTELLAGLSNRPARKEGHFGIAEMLDD